MSGAASGTALSVEGLRWRYGEKIALDGVSLEVARGRFCALLGPNGAGKSTLFGLLTRLFVAREGRIAVAGHDLSAAPRAALGALGVVFQQPTLDMDLSVRRNLLYFAALHGISGREARIRADAALDRLGMLERAHEKVRALNGGHRRRMELARALIHRPAVLLLDEPTVGLDAPSRAALVDHVHALCADDGIAALWATHLVDEVRPGDRLAVLHRGRVVADGEAAEIAASLGGGSVAGAFAALTGAGEGAAAPMGGAA